MHNDTEYINKWQRENTQNVGFRLIKNEFDAFDSLCKSIGIDKATYIKMLVNQDCERRGIDPVFKSNRFSEDIPTDPIPTHYINAIEYAKSNCINRTTMLQRLKNGKYPSAIHFSGKWYIDPADLT